MERRRLLWRLLSARWYPFSFSYDLTCSSPLARSCKSVGASVTPASRFFALLNPSQSRKTPTRKKTATKERAAALPLVSPRKPTACPANAPPNQDESPCHQGRHRPKVQI